MNDKDLGLLQDNYAKIKDSIINRLLEFVMTYKKADEKTFFIEIAFCILTPQSKAKSAWEAISKLIENDLLFTGTISEIEPYLKKVRFYKQKANRLFILRENFSIDGIIKAKTIFDNLDGDIFEKRKWLRKNVLGYGLKEASHFLRNIGFGDKIAILDRHILKNLVKFKAISEIPKTISDKKYIEIENKMQDFSTKINIPLDHLDLLLWYSETGEIFK